mgnify:CR=1 FL=1
MKKLSLYVSIALAGLFMGSCSDDFTNWANPQTNPQEDAITIPGFTATGVQAINFANVETDSVSTFTLSEAALPAGFTLDNARLELTPQGVENATKTTVNTSIEGKGAVADLSAAIVSVYGKRPSARTFDAQVYVNVVKDGQAVLIDAGKINLVMTPKAPFIDSNYYLVGQMTNWNLNTNLKFAHSDADVYEDPVFTIMFTTTDDNQYWKIIPQGNVDKGDIWSVENNPKGVVGVEKDGDDAMSGTLLTTTSKGEKAYAAKIAKAGIYQMTINMMDYTYTIKQIAPEYYLVGKLQGWSDKLEGKTCLMYAESAMVQSYTTQWNEDANLKIWLGSDFGVWANAYGAKDDGDKSVEGKIAGSGAIVCPEPGAFYTFKVDFSTMTYKWTKLENQTPKAYEHVGLIGVGNDWNNDVDMKEVTPHNWFIETTIPEGNFKIRANHEWDDSANWGYTKGQEFSSTGKLITSPVSEGIKVAGGKYRIFFNDITLEYAIISVAE